MGKEVEYIFEVFIKNGVIIPMMPKMYDATLMHLDMKTCYLHLSTKKVDKTAGQLGYYFGGIIRGTLMKTHEFAGWEFKEIDKYLRAATRTKTAVVHDTKIDKEITVEFVDADIENFSKEEMSSFIDDVMNLLAIKHDIHPLPPEYYKLNKYYQKI